VTGNTDQPSVTSSDARQVQGRVTSHSEKTQALLAKAQELLDAGDEAGAEPLIRQLTSTAELHALAGHPIERYEGLSDVLIEKRKGNPFLETSSQGSCSARLSSWAWQHAAEQAAWLLWSHAVPQPVDRVDFHQLADHGGGGGADPLGLLAAPGRGPACGTRSSPRGSARSPWPGPAGVGRGWRRPCPGA